MRPANWGKLCEHQNLFRGRRVWVVGNGPSLQQLDLSKLDGEIVIVCNLIFRDPLPFRPSYYCLEDKRMMWNFHKEIMAWHVPGMPKYFPAVLDKYVRGSDTQVVNFQYGNPKWEFSKNFAELVHWGASVSYMMLQLAFFLGADKTILIGMDCGDGHFTSEKKYYKGKKANSAKWDLVFRGYDVAKKAFYEEGRTICNATAGGRLEAFPRVPYEEWF